MVCISWPWPVGNGWQFLVQLIQEHDNLKFDTKITGDHGPISSLVGLTHHLELFISIQTALFDYSSR